MSRRLTVAAETTPEQSELAALPALHRELSTAVLERLSTGRGGFGSSLPIRAAAHDLLYNVDHTGHLGIQPAVLAMELVTRLALGDSLPPGLDSLFRYRPGDRQRHVGVDAVQRGATYVGVQAERMLSQGSWSDAATNELTCIADQVLSRIDVERVRLDWELGQRRAQVRILAIDQTVAEDNDEVTALEQERQDCQAAIDTTYIDYEGQLFDAVEAYYMTAADPFEWYGFIVSEAAYLAAQARGLLGLAEHSRRGMTNCPMCTWGVVGLAEDPDLLLCSNDRCGFNNPKGQKRLSDGTADAFFGAFRDGGWTPKFVA